MTVPVLTEVPVREGWDFGDFPYGLEPLTIPDAGTEPGGDGPCSRFAGLCTHLEHISRSGVPGPVEPVESSDRLYWFRWITGHQVTFVLWQLVARELAMAERGERDREAALASAALFTRGFSAMLLYTSSTPIDVYHEVIRPSMFLQHRGFSGTWAPDFAPSAISTAARACPMTTRPASRPCATKSASTSASTAGSRPSWCRVDGRCCRTRRARPRRRTRTC